MKAFAVIVALVAANLAWWWFGSPNGSSRSSSLLQSDGPVPCEVTHDGLLYAAKEATFVLAPGESFHGRFGPHDVRVSLLEETNGTTLEIETESRALPGAGTWGRSSGDKEITTGFGLGTLVIDCKH